MIAVGEEASIEQLRSQLEATKKANRELRDRLVNAEAVSEGLLDLLLRQRMPHQ